MAITLNVTEATNNVTLHANQLTVDEKSVALTRQDGVGDGAASTGVPISQQRRDAQRQFYIIQTRMQMKPGTYRVRLKFTGILGDDLQGFYRSSYIENNTTRCRCRSTEQSICLKSELSITKIIGNNELQKLSLKRG